MPLIAGGHGSRGDAQRMQGRLDTFRGTKTDVPQGGVLWVLALRDSRGLEPRGPGNPGQM